MALLVLVVATAGGAFIGSFFKELGEHGAKATIEVLKSGPIGRLAASRISTLAYRIDIINKTSDVDDSEVKNVVRALQDQVQGDFAPVWGVSAELRFVPRGKQPEPNSWWLLIFDGPDQAEMFGYHDITPNGLPIGKVFTHAIRSAGFSWSAEASRELLSMLIDPRINLSVFVPSSNGESGTLWDYEIVSPCQDEKFGYKKDGVLVSDFVTPAWFEPWATRPSSRFDFRDQIAKPFEVLDGGYASIYDLKSKKQKVIRK